MTEKRMPQCAHLSVIFAVVAVSGPVPCAGDEVTLLIAEDRVCGRVASIELHPSDAGHTDSAISPAHWSRLASIRFELPGAKHIEPGTIEARTDGRMQTVVLLDAATQAPVASGLIVASSAVADGEAAAKALPVSRGLTIWMTGLSGAGKTTIAQALEERFRGKVSVEMLDGDAVRTHICAGLGFAEEDRSENVRRLAWLASILAESREVVLVSAISPYRAMRDEARRMTGRFIEVYVNAPLDVCEGRDVKGLYKKARRGEVRSFTGVGDRYEPPVNPEIECRTDLETVEESVAKILAAVAPEVFRVC